MVLPMFVVPKKDKRVGVVSHFREVNMLIKMKTYPMPRINEMTQKRSGYIHFTNVDLSMRFYCFILEGERKKHTTIIAPDGQLYEYNNRLPMGIKISPDEAQAIGLVQS